MELSKTWKYLFDDVSPTRSGGRHSKKGYIIIKFIEAAIQAANLLKRIGKLHLIIIMGPLQP
jgi:hypothetical protein